MAIYRLTKPCFLGDQNPRYFSEGSVIDWNGPPNKAMVPVEQRQLSRDDRVEKGEDMRSDKARARAEAHAKKPPENRANLVLGPKGATVPDPTWAPAPRPAFSVPQLRDPKTLKPGEDEASIVRLPASPPSSGYSDVGSDEAVAGDAGRLPTDLDKPGEAPTARRGRPFGARRAAAKK